MASWTSLLLVVVIGLHYVIENNRVVGRVMEMTSTACNGPCGQMAISCPAGHHVAIRDAVYMVQNRGPSCAPFVGCGTAGQDVCCEPTSQDCVFAYSPAHLKVLHQQCSGNNSCVIQTERSEVETVTCASTESENLASQTALNYVCVNETSIVDICSARETVVEGKTLFATINPQNKRSPSKGSVCTCLADSVRWPTTNSIAVFLVDMRLNKKGSRACANSTITVRSGSTEKVLDCDTIRDPRINFPFVAVLNESNVASLRLEIWQHLPEFIWMGFEANEDEDIRLTCKLQGMIPGVDTEGQGRPQPGDTTTLSGATVDTNNGDNDVNVKPEKSKSKSGSLHNMPIIVGSVVAAIALILVTAIIVLVILRLRNPRRPLPSANSPEMDLYYSTLSDDFSSARNRNSSSSKQELYISHDDVKMRKTSNKRVRIVSTPDIVEDLGESYATAAEVREKKRKSTIPGRQMSETEDIQDDYDHLDNHCTPKVSSRILASYDQLEPRLYDDDDDEYSSVRDGIIHRLKLKGPDNTAYVETELDPHTERTLPLRPRDNNDENNGLYFELETRPDSQAYAVDASQLSSSSSSSKRNSQQAPLPPPKEFSNATNASPSAGRTFHDGKMTSVTNEMYTGPVETRGKDEKLTDAENSSSPVAAPRRKSRLSAQYDVAKPID